MKHWKLWNREQFLKLRTFIEIMNKIWNSEHFMEIWRKFRKTIRCQFFSENDNIFVIPSIFWKSWNPEHYLIYEFFSKKQFSKFQTKLENTNIFWNPQTFFNSQITFIPMNSFWSMNNFRKMRTFLSKNKNKLWKIRTNF